MANHIFTRVELETILNSIKGKTLGEVDKNNVFDKTKNKDRITGIAGDVIEQSVMEYHADTKQEADLLVDGIPTELKTTGIIFSKNSKKSVRAKESMSITAVSPFTIIYEEFELSRFWNKLEHTLLVYYLYDSNKTVKAAEYANFPIQGYQFHQFNEQDKKILKNDWIIVRNFIRSIEKKDIDLQYPKISKLSRKMMYLDTAPKWPNNPRFRLKQSVVTNIVRHHFGKDFKPLKKENNFTNYEELDKVLHNISSNFKGKTMRTIANELNISIPSQPSKAFAEQITVKMLGSNEKKLSNIDIFSKINMIPKTIRLSASNGRTEDIKFEKIDFDEWTNNLKIFEDSNIFNYFKNPMLFIIFKNSKDNKHIINSTFQGFKRYQFESDLLNTELKPVWEKTRLLIKSGTLKNETSTYKNGKIRYSNGKATLAPNFPKASENKVFFIRGTGQDSDNKKIEINGISMYSQNTWIRGAYLIPFLNSMKYI